MQAILTKLLPVIFSLALAGCVYPSTRSYYEVESTVGKTVPSVCTYPSSRKDGIYRDLGSGELYVTTYYDKDNEQEIGVSMEVSSLKHDVKITSEKLFIQLGVGNQPPIKPTSFRLETYDSGNSNDEFPIKNWVHLVYSLGKNGVLTFSLLFGEGAVMRGATAIDLKPITFKKVTKSGLYLFTINC